MLSKEIRKIADQQGWTDETLLLVLLDWFDIQSHSLLPDTIGGRILRYCQNRADSESESNGMQQEVYELVWRLPDDKFYALCERLDVTNDEVRREIEGWSESTEDPLVDERVAKTNVMVDKLRGGT